MKILTLSEYSNIFHQTLRNLWIEYGYAKVSWSNPTWLAFKLKEYDFYLKECGLSLSFSGREKALDKHWDRFNPDYTEEQLILDIDNIVKNKPLP